MIKTFSEFINESNIKITILDSSLFDISLNESFDYYLIDAFSPQSINGTSIAVSRDDKQRLEKFKKDLNSYIMSKGDIIGKFSNRSFKLKISPTEHFIFKFLRKEYEDPKNIYEFINPNINDGVDLLYNNKNLISKYLAIGIIKIGDKFLVESKDSSKYNMIASIVKDGDIYKVILISQMKGISTPYRGGNIRSKKIKLHPGSQDPIELVK